MNVDKVEQETLLKMKEDYLRYKQLYQNKLRSNSFLSSSEAAYQNKINANKSKKIIKKVTKKKSKK